VNMARGQHLPAQRGAGARTRPSRSLSSEEYQNLFHELIGRRCRRDRSFGASSFWNMFDFAVAGRNEGDTPGRNDKDW